MHLTLRRSQSPLSRPSFLISTAPRIPSPCSTPIRLYAQAFKSKSKKPAVSKDDDGEDGQKAQPTVTTMSQLKQKMGDAPMASVDAIRRKHFAEDRAKQFKQQITTTDPLIARAYAELEQEERTTRAWRRARGMISAEEETRLQEERDQLVAEGLNPNQGRWGQYLQKKRVRKSHAGGMPEIRSGVGTKFVKDRMKSKASKKAFKKSVKKSAKK